MNEKITGKDLLKKGFVELPDKSKIDDSSILYMGKDKTDRETRSWKRSSDKTEPIKEMVVLYNGVQGSRFDFKNPGDIMDGVYVSKRMWRKNIFSKGSFLYTFITETGECSFFLGGATDKVVSALFVQGRRYKIEYRGKIKIGRGRLMKDFIILQYRDNIAREE